MATLNNIDPYIELISNSFKQQKKEEKKKEKTSVNHSIKVILKKEEDTIPKHTRNKNTFFATKVYTIDATLLHFNQFIIEFFDKVFKASTPSPSF